MTQPKTTPGRRRRGTAIVASILAGVAMAGCGQTANDTRSATAGLPDLEQSLMAHEWLLDTSPQPITLVFGSDQTASGIAPCNTYRAATTFSGDDGLELVDISATARSCEPDVMQAEQSYLDDLAKVRTADVTDRDRLVLTGDGVRLSFTALDYEDAILGEWTIVNLRNGDAVTGPIDGTKPTATFDEDRTLVLTTGCNDLRSAWSLDGNQLTLEAPAQTMMACDQPAGVMEQEAALTAVLTDAETVEVTPNTLTILDDAGTILILATKA
jgi:heat shock protein HslJ